MTKNKLAPIMHSHCLIFCVCLVLARAFPPADQRIGGINKNYARPVSTKSLKNIISSDRVGGVNEAPDNGLNVTQFKPQKSRWGGQVGGALLSLLPFSRSGDGVGGGGGVDDDGATSQDEERFSGQLFPPSLPSSSESASSSSSSSSPGSFFSKDVVSAAELSKANAEAERAVFEFASQGSTAAIDLPQPLSRDGDASDDIEPRRSMPATASVGVGGGDKDGGGGDSPQRTQESGEKVSQLRRVSSFSKAWKTVTPLLVWRSNSTVDDDGDEGSSNLSPDSKSSAPTIKTDSAAFSTTTTTATMTVIGGDSGEIAAAAAAAVGGEGVVVGGTNSFQYSRPVQSMEMADARVASSTFVPSASGVGGAGVAGGGGWRRRFFGWGPSSSSLSTLNEATEFSEDAKDAQAVSVSSPSSPLVPLPSTGELPDLKKTSVEVEAAAAAVVGNHGGGSENDGTEGDDSLLSDKGGLVSTAFAPFDIKETGIGGDDAVVDKDSSWWWWWRTTKGGGDMAAFTSSPTSPSSLLETETRGRPGIGGDGGVGRGVETAPPQQLSQKTRTKTEAPLAPSLSPTTSTAAANAKPRPVSPFRAQKPLTGPLKPLWMESFTQLSKQPCAVAADGGGSGGGGVGVAAEEDGEMARMMPFDGDFTTSSSASSSLLAPLLPAPSSADLADLAKALKKSKARDPVGSNSDQVKALQVIKGHDELMAIRVGDTAVSRAAANANANANAIANTNATATAPPYSSSPSFTPLHERPLVGAFLREHRWGGIVVSTVDEEELCSGDNGSAATRLSESRRRRKSGEAGRFGWKKMLGKGREGGSRGSGTGGVVPAGGVDDGAVGVGSSGVSKSSRSGRASSYAEDSDVGGLLLASLQRSALWEEVKAGKSASSVTQALRWLKTVNVTELVKVAVQPYSSSSSSLHHEHRQPVPSSSVLSPSLPGEVWAVDLNSNGEAGEGPSLATTYETLAAEAAVDALHNVFSFGQSTADDRGTDNLATVSTRLLLRGANRLTPDALADLLTCPGAPFVQEGPRSPLAATAAVAPVVVNAVVARAVAEAEEEIEAAAVAAVAVGMGGGGSGGLNRKDASVAATIDPTTSYPSAFFSWLSPSSLVSRLSRGVLGAWAWANWGRKTVVQKLFRNEHGALQEESPAALSPSPTSLKLSSSLAAAAAALRSPPQGASSFVSRPEATTTNTAVNGTTSNTVKHSDVVAAKAQLAGLRLLRLLLLSKEPNVTRTLQQCPRLCAAVEAIDEAHYTLAMETKACRAQAAATLVKKAALASAAAAQARKEAKASALIRSAAAAEAAAAVAVLAGKSPDAEEAASAASAATEAAASAAAAAAEEVTEAAAEEATAAADLLQADADAAVLLAKKSDKYGGVKLEEYGALELGSLAAAAMGLRPWRPKLPGQKGLRILCLDGGGTRGVLTVGMLQQLSQAMGHEIHEVFDLVAGTSTGAIVAGLLGVKNTDVELAEKLYDELIPEIFQKSPLAGPIKLGMKQAYYDDKHWESVLLRLTGDQRMLDSQISPTSLTCLFLATLISVDPAKLFLARSSNAPKGQRSRYLGSSSLRVRHGIRMSTAAPTIFTPLELDNGATYCDGAFFANNPTAVAFYEAQRLFPGVPVECVVSLGSGCFFEKELGGGAGEYGWGTIVNQLVESSMEVERTHEALLQFLPEALYYRFNPRMDMIAIDETDPNVLEEHKLVAKEFFQNDPGNMRRLRQLADLVNDV